MEDGVRWGVGGVVSFGIVVMRRHKGTFCLGWVTLEDVGVYIAADLTLC